MLSVFWGGCRSAGPDGGGFLCIYFLAFFFFFIPLFCTRMFNPLFDSLDLITCFGLVLFVGMCICFWDFDGLFYRSPCLL